MFLLKILKKKLFWNYNILYLLWLYIIISMILLYVEKKAWTDWFSSIFDMLRFSIVTSSTVWYGDVSPSTIVWKSITMFLIFLGILIFWYILSKITDILSYNHTLTMKGLKKVNNKKGTIVVQGKDHEDTYLLLEEIYDPHVDIIIAMEVDEMPNKLIQLNKKYERDIIFISTYITNNDFFDLVNVNNISKVYLLDVDEDDTINIKSTIKIRQHNKDCIIVSEIGSENNREILLGAGANEVINVTDLWNKIIARAWQSIIIPSFLRELLSWIKGVNIYTYEFENINNFNVPELEQKNDIKIIWKFNKNDNEFKMLTGTTNFDKNDVMIYLSKRKLKKLK